MFWSTEWVEKEGENYPHKWEGYIDHDTHEIGRKNEE